MGMHALITCTVHVYALYVRTLNRKAYDVATTVTRSLSYSAFGYTYFNVYMVLLARFYRHRLHMPAVGRLAIRILPG